MENFNLGAGRSFIEYALATPDGLSFKLKVFNKNNEGSTELVLKQGMTTDHFLQHFYQKTPLKYTSALSIKLLTI